MGNLCCAREHSVQFSVQFFYTVKLHSLIVRGTLYTNKLWFFNPLNAELNPICHLLALLGGATIVVVSRLRVNTEVVNTSVRIVTVTLSFPLFG
jgi:hypothetical protein